MQKIGASPTHSMYGAYHGPAASTATTREADPPVEGFSPSVTALPPRLVVLDNHLALPRLLKPAAETENQDKPVPFESPHGLEVVKTALAQGYQGVVYPFEYDSAPFFQASEMKSVAERLWNQNETAEQLRSSLYAQVLANRVALLNSISNDLESFSQKGVTGSVVNVSLGSGLASAVQAFLDRIDEDRGQREAGYHGKRLCLALGLDHARLTSEDAQVSDLEAQKLMTKLLELAETSSDDLEYRASKARYDSSVQNFVANRNSLVVSA